MKKIIASLLAFLVAFSCLAALGFATDDETLNLNIVVDEPKAGSAAPSDAAVSDELNMAYTASAEEVCMSLSSLSANLKHGYDVNEFKLNYFDEKYPASLGDAVADVLWENPVCFAEKTGDTYIPVTEFECGKAYTVFVIAIDSLLATRFYCQKLINDFRDTANSIPSFKAYKDASDDYFEARDDSLYSNYSSYSDEDRADAKAACDAAYTSWKADAEGQADYEALYAEFDAKADAAEKAASAYSEVIYTINGNEVSCPVEDGFVYSYEFAPVSHVWKHSVGENSVSLFCENCEESYTVTASVPQGGKCSSEAKEITISGELPDGFSSRVTYETADGKAPKTAGEYKAYLELLDDSEEAPLEKAGLDIAISHNLVKHDAVAPECLKEGNEEYYTCNGCDYTTFKSVPALGHDFKNYKYNNDASVGKDGTKTAKCERCDATDTIPASKTALPAAILQIKNMEKYNGKTLNYRTTITFRPVAENCTDIRWAVSGADGEQNKDGSFTVSQARKNFTVHITAKDSDGKEVISETEVIKIKTDFFSKIVAFFKLLFNKDAYTIVQ